MEVTREQAIRIFQGLGYDKASGWSRARMMKKIRELPGLIAEDDDLDDNELDNVLDELIYAVENDEKISVVKESSEEPKEQVKEPEPVVATPAKTREEISESRKEAALKAKGARRGRPTIREKAQGRRLIRESHGRPYQAGRVLAEIGLERGVTTEMVKKVDAYLGSPNPKESEAWLKHAWHVINGFLNGEENAKVRPRRTGRR